MKGASPEFQDLRSCARPVVFETGVPDYPFSVAGTAFMVGFRNAAYVLTARHVVRDWPKEAVAFIVSPAGERLGLTERWEIQFDGNSDDKPDLLVFKADVSGVSRGARKSNHLLHLTPPSVSSWFDTRETATFFLFGYPIPENHPNYETSKVEMNQYLLNGSYIGPSALDGCHEISVKNPLSLSTFDGMSGAPVFSLSSAIGLGSQPTFCGMALRGTPRSQRVHFLGSETILAALASAHAA